MAYGQNTKASGKNYNKGSKGAPKGKGEGSKPIAAVKAAIPGQDELVRLTGLFVNINEETGKESVSGKTNQDITLPAGTRIFFFDNSGDQ